MFSRLTLRFQWLFECQTRLTSPLTPVFINKNYLISLRRNRGESLDFDDEAAKLFKSLNLSPTGEDCGGRFKPLDAVWRHPQTGGTIFVGNRNAAETLEILRKHKITVSKCK